MYIGTDRVIGFTLNTPLNFMFSLDNVRGGGGGGGGWGISIVHTQCLPPNFIVWVNLALRLFE